jgi:hypothetical protein
MILELRAFQYDGTRLADANRMKVFGDSTIKLNQHEITFNARDANNNPTSCSFKINGESIGAAPFTTTVINRASLVEAFDATHAFDHFSYNGLNYYNNPSTIPLTSDGTVTAYFNSYCVVTIQSNNNNYGTVDFAGTNYWPNNYYQMGAHPYSGYVFDHWESSNWNNIWFLDAQGPSTIAVGVGSGTITGVFTPATTHAVTFCYDAGGWNLGNLEIAVDGHSGYQASWSGTTYCLAEGWHTIEYPIQYGWFNRGSMYQDGTYLNDANFYVGADTVISCDYYW